MLPKDEALGFVANIMNEEEAVGVELQQPATTPSGESRAPNRGDESADEMDVAEQEGGGESMDEEEDDEEEGEEEGEEGGQDREEESGGRSSGGGKKRRVSGGGGRGRRLSSR